MRMLRDATHGSMSAAAIIRRHDHRLHARHHAKMPNNAASKFVIASFHRLSHL